MEIEQRLGASGVAAGGVDLDQLTAALQARVRAADIEARRRARHRPVRWPLLLVRLLLDFVMLNLALSAAYWLRYASPVGSDAVPELQNDPGRFLQYQTMFALISLLVFYGRGIYSQPRSAVWIDQLGRVAGAALIAVCSWMLLTLVLNVTAPARLYFFYAWLAIIAIFAAERYLVKQARIWLWQRGINEHRVAVVGATIAGQRVMKHIADRPDLGYKLVGYVDDRSTARRWDVPFAARHRPPRLGGTADLDAIIGDKHIDTLIIALGGTRRADLPALLERCQEQRVAYMLLPDLMELRFDRCQIEAFDGIPLIGLREPALRGGQLVLKRAMDISLAALVLLVCSPLLLLAALAIMVEKPRGSILFGQQRVGRGGRIFTCYKFRSMRPDAELLKQQLLELNEASGPIFKIRNDPRITRVGRVLRRTSIDELPQLFNILKGEMSWVGPRPPIVREITEYDDWHLRRLEITPGLTGLWQVSGRSNLSFDEGVTLDLYYLENWSLLLDLKILLRTLPAVVSREGAY